MPPEASGPGIGWAIALGIVVAFATCRSLLGVFGTAIAARADCTGNQCADNALVLWILTQAGRRLYTSPLALFEAPIFHPMRHALAYSESMLSAAAVVGPLERVTGNPIVAYNAHYLATFAISVVGMYLFVREITADRRAALAAGGLFGLATEHGSFWGFPPASAVHWAPVFLWTWMRFLARPGWRRGLACGLALCAHMHAGAYHGLMLPVLLVPWALVLALFGPWPLRRWLASAVPLAVAGALAAALYVPYAVVRDELQNETAQLLTAHPIQYYQALVDPVGYVTQPLFGLAASPLAWVLLAAAGLAVVLRRPRVPGVPLGAHLVAAILLCVLAMAVSIDRDVETPWGTWPGALALLRALPGFDSMRAAIRFVMLASLARTIVAGIALAIVFRRLSARAASVVVTVVLALAALDARLGVERPVWDVTVPAAWAKGYAWVAETPPDTAILELPYGQFGDDVRYMVYALSHRRALANGYSGTLPRFPDVFGRFPEDVAVQALEDAGVRYVLVHPSRLGDNPFGVARLAKLAQRQELLVASFDDTLVYAVPPTARPPEPPLGRPLPRDGWRFVPPVPGLERALDGDPATHWEASSATGPVTVRVDLGHETRLSAVVLALERHVLEYPRQYAVRGSLDGRTWRQLGAEGPTVPPFASYRRDHRDVRLRLRIEPATVRFLELTVGTYPRDAWWYTNGRWGIHELLVYESPPDG